MPEPENESEVIHVILSFDPSSQGSFIVYAQANATEEGDNLDPDISLKKILRSMKLKDVHLNVE